MENREQKMSHSPLKNVPSANLQIVVNWQMGHFSVANGTFFDMSWFNLISIPISPIYYTYIYSNIHNLSEKEAKAQKPNL